MAATGLPQKIHLLTKIVTPHTHQQMEFERQFFFQSQFAVLCFGQKVSHLPTSQHAECSGVNQRCSRHSRSPMRARCRMT